MSFIIENNVLKSIARPTYGDRKLGQVILDALDQKLDHVAQIDAETGEQTTCAVMKERSVRCALWMKKLGIGPSDIVVVVTHNHLDSSVPLFATFFVDAIFSAWNRGIALYTARRYIKKFTPKLIFTCEKSADLLVEAAKLENLSVKFVVFGEHAEAQSLTEILDSQTAKEVEEFVIVGEKNPEDVAAVMLSSGSTGFPKGVVITCRSILAMADKDRHVSTTLQVLWYSTLDWISCISLTLQTILKGNTRIIPSEPDVENFFQVIEKYKVNVTFIPPILISYVAKSDLTQKYDLSSLNVFTIVGSKIGKRILEGLQQKLPTTFICQCYAATETGMMAFATPESKHVDSIGFVTANCQIKFVDVATGKALGPNQEGELRVKTPNIMIGYFNDPEATKQAFDEQGWYRTGDIGFYNEAGEIFIVDRIKDIMKYRNNQISPAEIEEILLCHPEIQEAAVVSIPHELDGDWPAAFVKTKPGSRVTEEELMKFTSVLENYKKLRGGIHFMDNLPQSSTGKILKNELKKLVKNWNCNDK